MCDEASDLIQVMTPDGTLLYTNPTWRQILEYASVKGGASADRALTDSGDNPPLSFQAVLHPNDRDRVQFYCRALQSNGDSGRLQLTLQTAHGDAIPVEGRMRYRLDEEGLPQIWCLWRRSPSTIEQALRQVEERYSLATRAARVGVWEWQVQTGEFYLDPNVKAILGYTDAEIPNDLNLWVNYVHPEDRASVMAAAQAHLEGHTPEYVFEHRMLHKDGSIRWILVRGLAVRNAQGEVVRMVGTDADITDRKRSEILLELQNRILATIARGETLALTLAELMTAIETQLEGSFASILLLTPEGTVESAIAPHLPEAYQQSLLGCRVGEGVGSCGTAAFRQETVVVDDIASDPLWKDFRNLALSHHLRACWSTPIVANDGRVMGTFGVYYGQVRSPLPGELEILTHAANIASIAVERHQAEATIARQQAELYQQMHQMNQALEAKVLQRTTELQESEARFRRLVENLPGMVYSYVTRADGSDAFTFASSRCLEIYEVDPGEVLKNPTAIWNRVHPGDVEKLRDSIAECIQTNQSIWSLEHRIIAPSGQVKWVQATSHPGRQVNGDIVWEGFSLDISDRKVAEAERRAAEEALRSREAMLNLFFTQSINGFFFMMLDEPIRWDETTDKETTLDYIFNQQRMTRVNTALLDQYGATEEQFLGLTPNQLFAHDLHHGREVWRHFFDAGRLHQETDERKLDGTPIVIEGDYICLYDDQGRITGHFGVQRDVTQQRRAQAEILKTLQRERELHEMKSRFVSMMSHEFRTPLAVIQSAADLLQIYSNEWESKEDYFQQIQSSIRHMTRMLDDVLWIGKAELGQLTIQRRPVNATQLCREIIREFELAYGQGDRFRFNTVGDFQPTWLDQALLRQILNNLISNAVKYSPANSPVELRLNYQPHQMMLQVQDYGIGIPDVDQQRLFEAFYRAKNVDTIQGTGLGLAIVRYCVDLHHGQIVLESQVGVGTTFTIALPY